MHKNKKEKCKKEKSLLVRPDGIGDFVIFSAVLEKYSEIFKNYKFHLICSSKVKQLAETVPFINKIICLDTEKLFRKRYLVYTLISLIKITSYKYKLAIYPVYSANFNSDLIMRFVRAEKKIGFNGDSSNYDDRILTRNKYYTYLVKSIYQEKSEIERNLEFIQKLGVETDKEILKPKIWFSDEDDFNFQKLKQKYNLKTNKYIIISPGAGISIKLWRAKNWVKLIEEIYNTVSINNIVIVGSGIDGLTIQKIISTLNKNCGKKIINLYDKTSLRVLAKVIQNAKGLIGSDSCTIHMAAAVDTPNICLMGGGHFGRFYPYGDLGKNRIVFKKMGCYGCHWKCKFKESKCIQEINVEDVLKKINLILSN